MYAQVDYNKSYICMEQQNKNKTKTKTKIKNKTNYNNIFELNYERSILLTPGKKI